MTRRLFLPLLPVFACAALLAATGARAAETKFKTITYLTKVVTTSASAGTWERRGLCFFGEEIGTYVADGSFDMMKGKAEGKATCTFEDGSTCTWKSSHDVELQARGLQKFANGRGEFVGGAGRFEGVKGTLSYAGRTYTPGDHVTKGDAIVEGAAQYTLPSKPEKPTAQK